MTVSYDGKLILVGKVIEPCCAHMHRAVHSKVFYPSSANKAPVIALRLGDREAVAIRNCPFCGASVGVR